MRDKSLGVIKKRMAYLGYYNVTDFAKLKKVSKQFVSRNPNKFKTIKSDNRTWFCFDNGEHAEVLYGNPNIHLDKFLDFGFSRRLKSVVQSNSAIADVKRLSDSFLSIRFYNSNGDMLSCDVDVNNIELIMSDKTY
jgi:hypothetical protein